MLANCRDELKYRLNLRTSNFIQENVSNILSIFYDARSSIVHNGDISKELYKKMKTIAQVDSNNTTEILFYFLQRKVEPIIRKVLYKSFKFFIKSKNIKNYTQLGEYIDKEIIKNVTSNSV